MQPQSYLDALISDIYASLEQVRGEAEIHILANDFAALGGPLVKLNLIAKVLKVDVEKYACPDLFDK